MQTHLGRAISVERHAAQLTQDALAKRLTISRPALNLIERRQRRPDPNTLPRLVRNWPTAAAGIRIAIEHLRDEWQRCGLDAGAVEIRASYDSDTESAAADLRAIRSLDAGLYTTLTTLMRDIIRAAGPTALGHDAPKVRLVAETRATYSTRKPRK